eukprot:CAMPEP_0176425702 /NCGR_PEP_ID=MMETSP0127-20121128/11530_1 /TAXON_ID=938130 /ORGANISM="Platyophrya macrostoma, Strain WH" /LENGTH=263 /DNA_ID=CAMNT_0017806881 /DNA_START=120 /DNA_END=911 /DNA_ORIENTATION=+
MGKTRNGKQIRDRYLNKLNPMIRNSKWTAEEDKKLLHLYEMHGRKWCRISKELPGRTEAMVKNRFYSKFDTNGKNDANSETIETVDTPQKYFEEEAELKVALSQENLYTHNQAVYIDSAYSADQFNGMENRDYVHPYSAEFNSSEAGDLGSPKESIYRDFSDSFDDEKFNSHSDTRSQCYGSNGAERMKFEEFRGQQQEQQVAENYLEQAESQSQEAVNYESLDKQSQIKLLETRLVEAEKVFWHTIEEIRRIVNLNAVNINI